MSSGVSEQVKSKGWSLVAVPALSLAVCLFYSLMYAYISPPYFGITLTNDWVVTHIENCESYPGWCTDNARGLGELQVGDH